MDLVIWILGIVVYLISTYACWKWNSIAHSYFGIFKDKQPEVSDLFVSFLPGFNTIMCVFVWSFQFPYKKDNEIIQAKLNKFFKINKNKV